MAQTVAEVKKTGAHALMQLLHNAKKEKVIIRYTVAELRSIGENAVSNNPLTHVHSVLSCIVEEKKDKADGRSSINGTASHSATRAQTFRERRGKKDEETFGVREPKKGKQSKGQFDDEPDLPPGAGLGGGVNKREKTQRKNNNVRGLANDQSLLVEATGIPTADDFGDMNDDLWDMPVGDVPLLADLASKALELEDKMAIDADFSSFGRALPGKKEKAGKKQPKDEDTFGSLEDSADANNNDTFGGYGDFPKSAPAAEPKKEIISAAGFSGALWADDDDDHFPSNHHQQQQRQVPAAPAAPAAPVAQGVPTQQTSLTDKLRARVTAAQNAQQPIKQVAPNNAAPPAPGADKGKQLLSMLRGDRPASAGQQQQQQQQKPVVPPAPVAPPAPATVAPTPAAPAAPAAPQHTSHPSSSGGFPPAAAAGAPPQHPPAFAAAAHHQRDPFVAQAEAFVMQQEAARRQQNLPPTPAAEVQAQISAMYHRIRMSQHQQQQHQQQQAAQQQQQQQQHPHRPSGVPPPPHSAGAAPAGAGGVTPAAAGAGGFGHPGGFGAPGPHGAARGLTPQQQAQQQAQHAHQQQMYMMLLRQQQQQQQQAAQQQQQQRPPAPGAPHHPGHQQQVPHQQQMPQGVPPGMTMQQMMFYQQQQQQQMAAYQHQMRMMQQHQQAQQQQQQQQQQRK